MFRLTVVDCVVLIIVILIGSVEFVVFIKKDVNFFSDI
jgi:hypothetical protein